MKRTIIAVATLVITSFANLAHAADYLSQNERIKGRSYSPAVVTEGGRIVWLAGESATTDLQGKDIRGDIEGQTRTIFALLEQTLKRAGGSLKDIVSLTAYMTDPRSGPAYSKIRGEQFPDKNYPTSAQITISNLAVPGMLIEIHAIAVINDKCSKERPCIPPGN